MRYLCDQLRDMLSGTRFLVDADESDVTKWTIGIPRRTLVRRGQSDLANQLSQWAQRTRKDDTIVLAAQFPMTFPDDPPFVRVVRPRFVYRTGHVTIGGSFCTELLTPSGWHKMSVEVLLQHICDMLSSGNAVVQLESDQHCGCPMADYEEKEAHDAFTRAATMHGWK